MILSQKGTFFSNTFLPKLFGSTSVRHFSSKTLSTWTNWNQKELNGSDVKQLEKNDGSKFPSFIRCLQ